MVEFNKVDPDDIPPDFKPTATQRKAGRTTGAVKTTGAIPWTEIEQSLTATYMMAGGALALTPRVPDRFRPVGQSLMQNAEQCTAAWIEAARKDPKLAKALTKFVSGSAYAGLISAHMPILFAIGMAVSPRTQVVQEQGQDGPSPVPDNLDAVPNVSPLFNLADVGM